MKVNQNTSILFWLFKAKTSADGKSPIYCRITIEGKRAQFSTGKRISPELWDTKLGIAKGKSEETISINKELNKIRADLQRTYDRLEAVQHEWEVKVPVLISWICCVLFASEYMEGLQSLAPPSQK